jgi:hypothetical protein
MYALQCPQRYPRNRLPQVWLQEFTSQEQGKKGLMKVLQ